MSDTPSRSNLAALDAAHHLHPFADMRKLNADGARIIQRGEGVYIFDAEGRKYLDGFAGLWCVNIGYGRTEIADAVARQMNELPYYNTFFGTTTTPATLLAEKVCAHAGPEFNHVFFTNSGSEANDTWFAWRGSIGARWASRRRRPSSRARTAITARRSPAPAWAA